MLMVYASHAEGSMNLMLMEYAHSELEYWLHASLQDFLHSQWFCAVFSKFRSIGQNIPKDQEISNPSKQPQM